MPLQQKHAYARTSTFRSAYLGPRYDVSLYAWHSCCLQQHKKHFGATLKIATCGVHDMWMGHTWLKLVLAGQFFVHGEKSLCRCFWVSSVTLPGRDS